MGGCLSNQSPPSDGNGIKCEIVLRTRPVSTVSVAKEPISTIDNSHRHESPPVSGLTVSMPDKSIQSVISDDGQLQNELNESEMQAEKQRRNMQSSIVLINKGRNRSQSQEKGSKDKAKELNRLFFVAEKEQDEEEEACSQANKRMSGDHFSLARPSSMGSIEMQEEIEGVMMQQGFEDGLRLSSGMFDMQFMLPKARAGPLVVPFIAYDTYFLQ